MSTPTPPTNTLAMIKDIFGGSDDNLSDLSDISDAESGPAEPVKSPSEKPKKKKKEKKEKNYSNSQLTANSQQELDDVMSKITKTKRSERDLAEEAV